MLERRPNGSITARAVLRIAGYVEKRGHDAEALCRSVGLSLTAVRDGDARVPYAIVEALGERAAELTGDESFGLRLAADVADQRHVDAGLLLLMSSATLRVALERMVQVQRYWGDGERAKLVAARGGMSVRYALPGSTTPRHTDECALAEIAIGARALSGQDVAPRAVRFRHARPRDTREHAQIFRCPIEFGALHTEIELGDAVLDAPMKHANETYCAIFAEQVERAIRALPRSPAEGVSQHVRAAARAALAGGECSLAGTARVLGTSERTLQRRLREEGTSFAELVDALRAEMAAAYLERGASVQEIAWLLGYADATAFHHAYKRWTGTTPERARGPALRRGAGD